MKGKPLYERIYLEILEDIRSGKYKAGERLPSEKELCEIYHVSRITGKKAMDMLAEEDIIIRMPGRGSFVSGVWERAAETLPAKDSAPSTVIGVIMDGFSGSYGYRLIQGIEKKCWDWGYFMVLHCTNGSREDESRAIERMLSLGARGIIIMCVHGENFNSAVLKLAVEEYPIVLLDRRLKGVPVPYVGTDNQKAARELTDWLLARGHKTICFASHYGMDTSTIEDRRQGFLDSHLEHGLMTNESVWLTDLKATLPADRTEESLLGDYEKVKLFISSHPEVTAFFAVEYDIARIIRSCVTRMGLENRYTIVCFDGYDNMTGEEEFTHIRQDETVMGCTSVAILRNQFEGNRNIEPVLVPYHMIEVVSYGGRLGGESLHGQ